MEKEYITPDNLSIKNWAEMDRPREKLVSLGRSSLSDSELLAILIGSGYKNLNAVEVARSILTSVNNNLSDLGKLSLNELKNFKGIGEAKALTILAALELGRRRKDADPGKKQVIKSSSDVFNILKPFLSDLSHEEFWIIMLNRANKVAEVCKISQGGVTGTVADTRLIFLRAVEKKACGIILAHNHPSGNLKPSEADISLTTKLKEAGKIMEIPVLDHLIITDAGYYSFADEGLI